MSTAGKAVVTDTGKRGVGSNGKARAFDSDGECSECCGECAPGAACGTCTNTPAQYTVTFNSVSLCSSCLASPPYPTNDSAEVSWAAGDVLNASHTLTQTVGDECEWTLALSNAIHIDLFWDNACASPDVDYDEDVKITLTRTTTEYTLTVEDLSGGVLFTDTQTANTDGDGNQLCATVPTFTNDQTSCGTPVATGGTATVVCV